MDTYTSVTYSIQKHNDDTVKKIEYNSTITDNEKQISTYYNQTINNDKTQESFTKLFRNKSEIYEQIGCSQSQSDWNVQEYHNNNLQKQYVDPYPTHNFDKCLTDFLPAISQAENKYLIDNK